MKHVNSIYKIRIVYEWSEDFILKYAWSAAGYLLISIPVLLRRKQHVAVQATGQEETSSTTDNAVARRTEGEPPALRNEQ